MSDSATKIVRCYLTHGALISSVIVVVLLHLWNVVAYSPNVPAWDDYNSVFGYLLNHKGIDSPREIARALVEQHNEHRVVFNRLMTLANFWILGKIDFRLHMLGATIAFLVSVFALLLFCAPKVNSSNRLLAALPALLVLMNPQYGDGMLWTTTAVQGFFCNLCAITSLILLERTKQSFFLLAALVASISVITQGNGLCIFVAGLCLLCIQRRWYSAVVWGSIGAVVVGLNIYFFVKPSDPPPLSETILQIPTVIGYGLAFLGSPLGFDNVIGAVVSGILVCVLVAELFRRGLLIKAPALGGIILFLILTAALNSLVRYPLGIEYASQAARYRMVSLTLLACCYLGAHHVLMFRSKRVFATVVAATGVYWAFSSIWCKESLHSYRERLVVELGSWCTTGVGLTYPYHDMSNTIMTSAIEEKVYDPASVFRANGTIIRDDPQNPFIELPHNPRMARRLAYNIDTIHRFGDEIAITGWAVEKKEQSDNWSLALLLRDSEGVIRRYPTEQLVRNDVVEHLKTGGARLSGFLVAIHAPSPSPSDEGADSKDEGVPEQGAEIGFEVVSKRGIKRYMTGKRLVYGEPSPLLSRCFR